MKKCLMALLMFPLLAACSSRVATPMPLGTPPPAGATASPSMPAWEATKLGMLTAEVETQTALAPQNDATITAIMATKYAGGTAAAGTMTAEPTLTPTPTIPPGSAYCTLNQLSAAAQSNGATGSIILGARLTNTSSSPCFLPVWPQAALVDGQGDPLDVQYNFSTMANGPSGAGSAAAPGNPQEQVGLVPGWSAVLSMIWSNWCGGSVPGGVFIRLTLPDSDEPMVIPMDVDAGGRCDAPGEPSSVSIVNVQVYPPGQ